MLSSAPVRPSKKPANPSLWSFEKTRSNIQVISLIRTKSTAKTISIKVISAKTRDTISAASVETESKSRSPDRSFGSSVMLLSVLSSPLEKRSLKPLKSQSKKVVFFLMYSAAGAAPK